MSKKKKRNTELLEEKIEKLYFLRKELSKAYDSNQKYSLTKDIEALDQEIKLLKQKKIDNNTPLKVNNHWPLKNILSFSSALIIFSIFVFFSIKENRSRFESDKALKKEKIHIDSTFKILVFPFNTKIDEISLKRNDQVHHLLASKLEKYKNINVEVSDSIYSFFSYKDARKIGNKKKVDLILWGDAAYLKSYNDSILLNLRYQLINDHVFQTKLDYLADGETTMKPYKYVDLLSSGKLVFEVEDLINWTLGYQAFKNRTWNKAKSYFIKILNSETRVNSIKDSDKAIVLGYISSCELNDGNKKSAKSKLFKCISLDSTNFSNYNTLSTLYYSNNNIDSALFFVNKAIKFGPNEANSYGNRSSFLARKNKFHEALKDINEALRIQPEFIIFHGSKANLLNKMRRFEEALEHYDLGIKFAKKDKRNNYIISVFHSRKARLYTNLYKEEIKGIKPLKNHNYNLTTMLGEAMNQLSLAKKYQINGIYFNSLGYFHLVKKNYSEAIKNYNNAIKIFKFKNYRNADSAEAFNGRGSAYLLQKRYKMAIVNFTTAIDIVPNPSSYRNRAICYSNIGRVKLAKEDNKKALIFETKGY